VEKTSLIFVFDSYVRASLHMFFVLCSIDLLFLDDKKRVVEVKQEFKPFRFYLPKKRFMYLIEMPSGNVEASKTQVGDVLGWS